MSFSVNAPCPQQQGSENYEQWGIILQRATDSLNVPVMNCMQLCAVQSSVMYAFLQLVLQKSRVFFLRFHELTKTPIKQ